MYEPVLAALLKAPNPPTNYALTVQDVKQIALCFDWEGRWVEQFEFDTLADLIVEDPEPFLNDLSTYYEGEDGPDRFYNYRDCNGRRK